MMPKWQAIFPSEQSKDPLMERAVLADNRLFGVYLHRFKADSNRPIIAGHDHPWDFITVVLAGGYDEQRCCCHSVPRTRGAFGFRTAETVHKLRLHATGALTLCVRGPARKGWAWRALPGGQ